MTPDQNLEKLLSSAPPPLPSSALYGQILADFRAEQQRFSWRSLPGILWPFGPLWQPVAALALVAAVGLNANLTPTYDDQSVQFANADFSALVLGNAYLTDIETEDLL